MQGFIPPPRALMAAIHLASITPRPKGVEMYLSVTTPLGDQFVKVNPLTGLRVCSERECLCCWWKRAAAAMAGRRQIIRATQAATSMAQAVESARAIATGLLSKSRWN
jgi:hypothetical protein